MTAAHVFAHQQTVTFAYLIYFIVSVLLSLAVLLIAIVRQGITKEYYSGLNAMHRAVCVVLNAGFPSLAICQAVVFGYLWWMHEFQSQPSSYAISNSLLSSWSFIIHLGLLANVLFITSKAGACCIRV